MCVAAPGKVVRCYEVDGLLMGEVDFGGVTREVCLAHVPEVQAGEQVMVHAGFALEIIAAAEVEQFYTLWQEVLAARPGGPPAAAPEAEDSP
ncbi:MAG TPA: HypC/HybG/HupF family hydrogenase formation chaperone [bacterium]|nr:HypC/HybG/HupF family hydrogenase formation chaperone [bacterium]HPR88087.1 HypC/HybG/HupF family hydrogenase formation chaperone [bacterium]